MSAVLGGRAAQSSCIYRVPRLRYQPPDRLPGATEFSKDDALRGSLNTVRLLKSQRWAWDELREACADLEVKHARRREPGHWELAAVAFIASKHVDIQPWWDESTDELWRECGFTGKPPYLRVWRRLRELEAVCEAFLDAAGKVIRRCREHDERVMAHVHFDFTRRTRRTRRSSTIASRASSAPTTSGWLVCAGRAGELRRDTRCARNAFRRVSLAASARSGTRRTRRRPPSTSAPPHPNAPR